MEIQEHVFSAAAQEEALLAQFEQPELLMIGDKEIRVVDVRPDRLRTPVATVLVPGFSMSPASLKDPILRMAMSKGDSGGRRVISAYAPHGVETRRVGEGVSEVTMRKLESFLGLIEAKGLERINVVAISEGAMYVALAAVLHPEKFENIVFVAPAGLIGKDNIFSLIYRNRVVDAAAEPVSNFHMKKVKYPPPDLGELARASMREDLLRSFGGIRAIAGADITKALERIHASGIGVSIIHGVDDKIFPMERVQKMTKSGMVDGFYSVKGTHNSLYSYEPYGRAVEAAMTALEERGRSIERRGS